METIKTVLMVIGAITVAGFLLTTLGLVLFLSAFGTKKAQRENQYMLDHHR